MNTRLNVIVDSAISRLVFVASPALPKRQPLLALCGKWLNAEFGDATGMLARSGDHALVVLELPAERAALVRDVLRRPESQPGSKLLIDEVTPFRWFSAGVVGRAPQLDAEQLMALKPGASLSSQVMCTYTAKLSSAIKAEPDIKIGHVAAA
jgi:hypothetical protein